MKTIANQSSCWIESSFPSEISDRPEKFGIGPIKPQISNPIALFEMGATNDDIVEFEGEIMQGRFAPISVEDEQFYFPTLEQVVTARVVSSEIAELKWVEEEPELGDGVFQFPVEEEKVTARIGSDEGDFISDFVDPDSLLLPEPLAEYDVILHLEMDSTEPNIPIVNTKARITSVFWGEPDVTDIDEIDTILFDE